MDLRNKHQWGFTYDLKEYFQIGLVEKSCSGKGAIILNFPHATLANHCETKVKSGPISRRNRPFRDLKDIDLQKLIVAQSHLLLLVVLAALVSRAHHSR